jgi:cytochrome b subunit of formate dehydrogenase
MATVQKTNDHAPEAIHRFTLAQRLEHALLLISFTTLVVTGLPQKFAQAGISEWMIGAMGGIEMVRIIHRIAAIVIILQSVYHIVVVGYKIYVKRIRMTMLPGLKDATDAIDLVRYNLGLTKEHPKMPRYNFAEKAEYWAMVWGTVVMAITGAMLWNPIATARFLPGQAIPAAKAAHGGEAILAALAILVWHFYNVHIKMFNKSMFTGKMDRHHMEEEHGEELHEVIAGETRLQHDPAGVRRRERVYLPIALFVGLVIAVGVYLFATFEETAIATLPSPATQVPAFAPLTPTPGPEADATSVAAALIPHAVEGREQCDSCHGLTGMSPFPANHEGRPNESCTVCHLPGPTPTPGAGGEQQGGAGAIPHPIEGDQYTDCTACHGLDKMAPFPENHTAFPVDSCTGCHQPAAEAGAGETPEAEETGGGPSPVPHPVEGDQYADCSVCHGLDKMKPFPENHTAFPVDSCTACHQPAEETSAEETPTAEGQGGLVMPAALPANHDLTAATYQDCAVCHGRDKIRPFPQNHVNFELDTCTTCHRPAE